MKVVGLISGGKDSIYNLCHCVANGHEIVALATLGPPSGKAASYRYWEPEEIDSFLYQTVGQDGVHLVSHALDLPLYRRTIEGKSVDVEMDYGGKVEGGVTSEEGRHRRAVEGDETEDLYQLLQVVKDRMTYGCDVPFAFTQSQHPDVTSVSVGAILSNYQRIRVEHVCSRLGLTPLAYLWQRDQSELLSEMVEAGLEAVLIKVAGAGLRERHLGKTLGEMEDELTRLNQKYGLHVCGEGGEYESFTVDSPLYKRRIRLIKTEPVLLSTSSDEFSTVAFLRLREAQLEPESPSERSEAESHGVKVARLRGRIHVPPLLDHEAEEVKKAVDALGEPVQLWPPKPAISRLLQTDVFNTTSSKGDRAFYGNIVTSRKPTVDPSDANLVFTELSPAAEDMKSCFQKLQELLRADGLSLSHVTHVNLYLHDMSDFASVNAVYNTFFGSNPPTRACVSVDLPGPERVRMDAQASKAVADRKALHVQGLSYWAPANIGPYSQAVTTGERIFIAGQIGLIPSSLALPEPISFSTEAALSTQHVTRIVKAFKENAGGGGWRERMEGCICWVGPFGSMDGAREAWKAWQGKDAYKIPVIFVRCRSLPRSASVEWQVSYWTGHIRQDGDDENDEDVERAGDSHVYKQEGPEQSFRATKEPGLSFSFFSIDSDSVTEQLEALGPRISAATSVRLFYLSDRPERQLVHAGAVTTIPVREIRTLDGKEHQAAYCLLK